MSRYEVFKGEFPFEWCAYDRQLKISAYGWNPQQALKRVKSEICKRWYDRHARARKRACGNIKVMCAFDRPQWEWDQIFKTTQGHWYWDTFNGAWIDERMKRHEADQS